jgi:hypothetical protein
MSKMRLELNDDGEVENMDDLLRKSSERALSIQEVTHIREVHLSARELLRSLNEIATADPTRHALLCDQISLYVQLSKLRAEEKRIWLGVLSWTSALSAPESSGEAIAAVHMVAAFVLALPTMILCAMERERTGIEINYLISLAPYFAVGLLSTIASHVYTYDHLYERFGLALGETRLVDENGWTVNDDIADSLKAVHRSIQTMLSEALTTKDYTTEVTVSNGALRKAGRMLAQK